MSIFRLIFALEILSFIKVSSFRLVKEIGVGAMPFFDFLVLWLYVLYRSILPPAIACIRYIFITYSCSTCRTVRPASQRHAEPIAALSGDSFRSVSASLSCRAPLPDCLCRTACGVLLPAVKNKCGLFLFCAFLLVYSHYELKHTEKSHVYRRYCVDGA